MFSLPAMGSSNSRSQWDAPPPYTPLPITPQPLPYRNYQGPRSSIAPTKFGFGIEIEAVVQPWKSRPDWIPAQYYERLAQALRNRDLSAKADSCRDNYRKHPEHYDKWFITRDGSLASRTGCISLECVSPKMNTDENWEEHIKLFWEAMRKVFDVQKDTSCGSHIHVAPIGRRYTLGELKTIAFAVCIYESYVYAILPSERRNNQHCERNSKVAVKMGNSLRERRASSLRNIANEIKAKGNTSDLCAYIQGSTQNRKVLWNFQNTIISQNHNTSGTIEFRGGRHLRGKVRTLRWITFAIAFISMALEEDLLNKSVALPIPSSLSNVLHTEVTAFWNNIRKYAYALQMEQNIPSEYKMMNETKRET